jgi:hypothetical protein
MLYQLSYTRTMRLQPCRPVAEHIRTDATPMVTTSKPVVIRGAFGHMVGAAGLEPATFGSQSRRASQTALRPAKVALAERIV